MSLLDLAESITRQPRKESREAIWWLSHYVSRAQMEVDFPLVEGEDGAVSFHDAMGRLASGRLKREGGGPVRPLESWLQAEVVAACVAAAHEIETGEPVLPDAQDRLREDLTAFGIQLK